MSGPRAPSAWPPAPAPQTIAQATDPSSLQATRALGWAAGGIGQTTANKRALRGMAFFETTMLKETQPRRIASQEPWTTVNFG